MDQIVGGGPCSLYRQVKVDVTSLLAPRARLSVSHSGVSSSTWGHSIIIPHHTRRPVTS